MSSRTSNLFVTSEFLDVNRKFFNNALIRSVFSIYWPTSVKLVEMQCLYLLSVLDEISLEKSLGQCDEVSLVSSGN